MGVKWPEILWEIQKYSLPDRPSSQNWVKSKTICHFLRNFDEFFNLFGFYSILAGWSTWQWVFLNFSQNFWSFDTNDTPGCASAVIWNHLKQIWGIPPTISLLFSLSWGPDTKLDHWWQHRAEWKIVTFWSKKKKKKEQSGLHKLLSDQCTAEPVNWVGFLTWVQS